TFQSHRASDALAIRKARRNALPVCGWLHRAGTGSTSSMSQVHRTVARRRLRDRQANDRSGSPALKIILITIAALIPLTAVTAAAVALGVFQHYSDGYEPIEEVLVERPAGITRVYDRTGTIE